MNNLSKRALQLSLLVIFPFLSYAQKPNWFNLDLKTDTTFGISTEKAYAELLKGKKSKPVLVGVLDGGVDYNHEDLKRIVWVNKREIAGNGKDDDKNGYIDDIHGWNYLGSAKGSVAHETLELTRLLRRDRKKFENVDAVSVAPADKEAYEAYQKMKAKYDEEVAEAKGITANIEGFKNVVDGVVKKIGKENPTLGDFQSFQAVTPMETRIKTVLISQLQEGGTFKDFYDAQILKGLEHYKSSLDYNLNMDYDPRPELVGDNYADSKERFYGNSDIKGPDASHGTHVGGIIAADRTNNLGIKGVADNVQIMGVRAVPDGDERDKDVANSIRYAVDNGAKVLNMSFGKAYSWDKAAVDAAVKYAMSKDVLLVQAAGNDNKDIDKETNFPNRKYLTGETAAAYLVVGASGPKDDETLKADFSNFGKTAVDVFAPGVNIYSTIPEGKYASFNGTSMAAPVVAGLAALIRSYYPKLTALQVKEIIMKSVVKVNHNVTYKVGEEDKSVPFSDLCISGGIVNAYNALKLAATYK
ncbi:S8 family peptidase [Pedobacter sp. MC2016-14]|uniref:S8 family peptidase n=1 Tax=Pedobacter sp. MC2016-14 TaxID=2897327 RepID=UPI001E416DF3|nr:S8 family peptidase [Pedobacter sp. MC2016-14]MCD0486660.1 S8 family peptidase [Pedobacter sp. MC2016-14]